ncbi:MFS transporter [Ferruginibacter sp.]|uniref:MFS transporter n=1 Tax=Ferruginibacter sp. TaxID=1940288 RepID=UPI001995D3A7|nr:MFS transporter [Ferruginibacter sp.]MBC7629050.1 MFS transporter [Ferruginibacter sp.]
MQKTSTSIFTITVLVAALGYFVDIYDLLLFNIVRIDSLTEMGLSVAEVKTQGEFIISIQMLGLLIGGIIWGIMGDKKGRLSVLFGSIILYSLANIANGFVQTSNQYALTRFIAGIGLAGELGAGITLVTELVNKEKRGLSTSLVAGIGLLGAVAAFFISQNFNWRICYFIGGGLGFCLLLLRISVFESGMFTQTKLLGVSRGNFSMFFTSGKRFRKYACAILIGLPTWYVIGLLIAFSNNFAKEFGITETVLPKVSIMVAYAFISISDLLAGFVSQWLKSRKKALYIFYILTIISIIFFFNQQNGTAAGMYVICAALGFATGFWAIFVTMAAEQFGTNLRATAATTVPNMVRGSVPLIFLVFKWLQTVFSATLHPYITAAWVTGVLVMVTAIIAAYFTEETFGKDLNYTE